MSELTPKEVLEKWRELIRAARKTRPDEDDGTAAGITDLADEARRLREEADVLKAFIRQARKGVLELSRLIPTDADVRCHCGCKASEHNDGCIHADCPGWDWPSRPYDAGEPWDVIGGGGRHD